MARPHHQRILKHRWHLLSLLQHFLKPYIKTSSVMHHHAVQEKPTEHKPIYPHRIPTLPRKSQMLRRSIAKEISLLAPLGLGIIHTPHPLIRLRRHDPYRLRTALEKPPRRRSLVCAPRALDPLPPQQPCIRQLHHHLRPRVRGDPKAFDSILAVGREMVPERLAVDERCGRFVGFGDGGFGRRGDVPVQGDGCRRCRGR
jgi:hypothetical protein